MSKDDDSMFWPVVLLVIALFIGLAAGTSTNIDDDVSVCVEPRTQLGC